MKPNLAATLLAAVCMASSGLVVGQSDVEQQRERQVTQPGNNAPVWREVQSGTPNYSATQGREMGVLIQPRAQFPGQKVSSTAGEA